MLHITSTADSDSAEPPLTLTLPPLSPDGVTAAVCRLWDAVGGFLFLFSHMQDKLSRHASQVDLLRELLNLQQDMIIMMLSMLEGQKRRQAAAASPVTECSLYKFLDYFFRCLGVSMMNSFFATFLDEG